MKTEINYRKAWLLKLDIEDEVRWEDPTGVNSGVYIIDDITYPDGTDIEDAEFHLICDHDMAQYTALGFEIFPKE
jgi:hypothetical protein